MKIKTLAVSAALLFSAAAGFAQLTWQGADVGGPKTPGGYQDNGDGTLTINGGGWDIWGGWDGYYYYYTTVTGVVWDASVRIQSFDGPDWWSKCNLMVHYPAPNGEFWRMANYPFVAAQATRAGGANTIEGTYRPNIETDVRGAGGAVATTYPNQWLRISRQGPVFQMLTSTDGVNWTQRTQWDTSKTDNGFSGNYWPEPLYVGIAVTSHNNDNTNAVALVSNLTVEQKPINPPTTVTITLQPTNRVVYAGQEVSFFCDSANNAQPALPSTYTSYQWYRNGSAITGATGKTYTFLTTMADNSATFYCKATLYGAEATSSTATLTVQPGTIYAGALRCETFWGATSRVAVEGGASGPGALSAWTAFDQPADVGNNYVRRVSGYFIPQTSGNYEFFINTDDDSDLFLSTDETPANKRFIAQETGWSNPRKWLSGGNTSQKRSTTFTPDNGVSYPYSLGINLTAGQRYYIEAVHREGGGGDNLSVWAGLVAPDGNPPLDDDPSTLTSISNNIALMSGPVTNLAWVTEPPSGIQAPLGQTIQLNSQATTDCEFPINYRWYRMGAPAAVGSGASLTMTLAAADNNAQLFVVASTPIGGLVITSKVTTISVQTTVFEPSLVKVEVWNGLEDRTAVADGTAGLPTYTTYVPKFQLLDGNWGDKYTRKVSTFFVAPSTADYVFYVCSDDDTALYLSTNDVPSGKQWIALQTDWANARNWLTGGNTQQKRSDSFSPDNGVTYPGAAGYHLIAGQKYYMEAVHHEGTGGDNVGVTYNTTQEPGPNDGDESRLANNLIGIMAPRSKAWFVQQPQSTVAAPYTYARLSVVGGTDSTLPLSSATDNSRNTFLQYQWQRGGVDIAGATASTLTLMVTSADNGAQFACKMRSLGLANDSLQPVWTNSATATLTVQGVFEPGFSTVEFWLNATRATVLANTAGTPQYVTTSPAFEANTDGGGDPPAGINNYARRITGFVVPSETAVYDFFVTSDDDSDVYLTTNGMSPSAKVLICQQPSYSGARQWQAGENLPQRRSDTWSPDAGVTVPYSGGFSLTAGQKYYLEVVHHEGGGGDNVSVTMIKRGNPVPANGTASTLTGSQIGTYAPKSTVAFTMHPTNVVVNGPVTAYFYAQGVSDSKISVGVTGAPVTNQFVMYQWYKNDIAIPGATGPVLAYPVASAADQGASFLCKIRSLGFSDAGLNPIWSNSTPATLTINDSTPPAIAYVSMFTDVNVQPNVQIIDILFTKRMDPATLGNPLNYTIPGLTVVSVQMRTNDYAAVRLTVTGTPGSPLTVSVNNLKDYVGNSLPAGASMAAASVAMTSKDIGFDRGVKTNASGVEFPLHDPQFPSTFWVDGAKAFTVSAQGSDIWNTNDGFNFTYEMKTGNFDIAVRQVYITRSDVWAKGGLMARESLNPSSRHWSIFNTPSDNARVVCNGRTATAGASYEWHTVDPLTLPAPAYPNAWVRLQRQDNVMKAYSSTNGVDWLLRGTADVTQVGSSNALPAELYVGIATTGHNNDDPEATWQQYWNTSSYANYGAVTLAPMMTATLLGNNLVISWAPAGGRLMSSPSVGASAAWTEVGTENPATVPLTAGPRFFRVANP